MRRKRIPMGAAGMAAVALMAGHALAAGPAPLPSARQLAAVRQSPLRFEPNQGQAPPEVRFLSRGDSTTLMLTDSGAYLVTRKPDGKPCRKHEAGCEVQWKTSVVKMRLEGARTADSIRGVDKLPSHTSYLLGNDASQWRVVPNYAKVETHGVYEGVDMVFHGAGNRLEYDFVVAPGADPDQIRLAFDGVSSISVDKSGDLLLATATGTLRQHKPVVFQMVDGKKVEVAGGYEVSGQGVKFALADYDHSRPLVVDPVLSFAAIVGTTSPDTAKAIATDSTGNFYMTGITTSTAFPVTGGSPTAGQSFIQKYNAGGTLIYSAMLGASTGFTSAQGLAVDGAQQAILVGFTTSANFPTVNAFQTFNQSRVHPTAGLVDGFVTKLNTLGTGFVFSTYLGGSHNDQSIAVTVDSGGLIFVASETISTDFPVASPFQTKQGTVTDAAVTRMASNGAVQFSTYLGGTNEDTPRAIAVDGNGAIYVTGNTKSSNFPVLNAFDSTHNDPGFEDGFVTKFVPPSGSAMALAWSTFLGGNGLDNLTSIAVNSQGEAFVGGLTLSNTAGSAFPVTNGSWFSTPGGVLDGVLVKFSATGGSLAYSTRVAGGSDDQVLSIALDPSGALYFGGVTVSANLTAVNTPGNMCTNLTGNQDIFLGKLNANGAGVEWFAFLGGSQSDDLAGVARDTGGNLWFAGPTVSPDFPVFNSNTSYIGAVSPTESITDSYFGKIAPTGAGLPIPTVTAPTEGQVLLTSGVTFSWTTVSGATGYDMQIFDRIGRTTVFSGQLSGNSSTSTLLIVPAGQMVFRVRACFDGGFSNCSAYCSRNFSVNLPAPAGVPTITNPTAGANITTSTINFAWTAVTGADSYELRIFNTVNNALNLKIVVQAPATNTIYTMKSGSYQVQVRACTAACGPADAKDFTVALGAIPTTAPTGFACLNSNVNSANSLTCNWNAVAGADLYVIQVIQPTSGAGGGALTVASRQVSATTVTLAVPNGFANIIVQACNGDGCGPAAAITGGITFAFGNPAQPILGQPVGGRAVDAGSDAVRIEFSWNRVAGDTGANGYRYRIFVQDFSRQEAALNVVTTANFHAAFFNAGSRFDALVIAIPPSGPEVAGPPQGFNTLGSNPNAPTPTQPAHNDSAGAGNVELKWTPIPTATGSTVNRLYQYFVAVQGAGNPSATGTTTATLVRVPLTANATPYSAIMRVCTNGTNCSPNSDTGWGPWSNLGQGGVTNFRVQ